jgi:predicted HAD superfamily Cof-like phosphohydrolase
VVSAFGSAIGFHKGVSERVLCRIKSIHRIVSHRLGRIDKSFNRRLPVCVPLSNVHHRAILNVLHHVEISQAASTCEQAEFPVADLTTQELKHRLGAAANKPLSLRHDSLLRPLVTLEVA